MIMPGIEEEPEMIMPGIEEEPEMMMPGIVDEQEDDILLGMGMNEYKTHSNWAQQILYLAEVFGTCD